MVGRSGSAGDCCALDVWPASSEPGLLARLPDKSPGSMRRQVHAAHEALLADANSNSATAVSNVLASFPGV